MLFRSPTKKKSIRWHVRGDESHRWDVYFRPRCHGPAPEIQLGAPRLSYVDAGDVKAQPTMELTIVLDDPWSCQAFNHVLRGFLYRAAAPDGVAQHKSQASSSEKTRATTHEDAANCLIWYADIFPIQGRTTENDAGPRNARHAQAERTKSSWTPFTFQLRLAELKDV